MYVTVVPRLPDQQLLQLTGIEDDENVPFLPPALPEGYGRKYTIVLDMDALAQCTQANVCP